MCVEVGLTDIVPDDGSTATPSMVTETASVTDHWSCELWPLTMQSGVAVKPTAGQAKGGGSSTVTVTCACRCCGEQPPPVTTSV